MSKGPPPKSEDLRTQAIADARAFVHDQFDTCLGALLGGSLARGEPKTHSDLDVLIITDKSDGAYRETFRAGRWVIEAFIETPSSVQERLINAAKTRNPSFLRLCAEGIILVDRGSFAQNLIDIARAHMKDGPPELSPGEVRKYRYIITDWLDDLADTDSFEESLFIVHELASKASEFLLGQDRCWIGETKWLYRALKENDNPLANELINGLNGYYRSGEPQEFIQTVEAILEPVGGRLYEGFSDREKS